MVKYDRKDTYQGSAIAPLNREHDDNVGGDEVINVVVDQSLYWGI